METIFIAIISSGLLSVLVTEVFGLLKARKSKKDGVESKLKALADAQNAMREDLHRQEKDNIRTELKLMISDFPDDTSDILKLAEHYFVKLNGNWTMNRIFTDWAKAHDVEIPGWFKH